MATSRSSSKSKYVPSQLLSNTGRGRSRHCPRASRVRNNRWNVSLDVAQTGRRIDGDRLGRGELGTRCQQPLEAVRIEAEAESDRGILVDLGVGQEVAGVDQAQPDGLADVLRGARPDQRQERRLFQARRAPKAFDDAAPRDERRPDDVALAGPGAVERDELPLAIVDVQGGAHEGRDARGRGAVVPDGDAPGDRRVVTEDGQPDRGDQSTRCIEQVDLERVRLGVILRIRAGQTGQSGFPARDRCAW